ncbi:hypothetical protein [Cupriavidus sp. BIS7]|uniref:hypothetical protein n=1 Tax=Cupriavidus sp. BIS7 TaxID=1217718 RepID=UPI0012F63201|nr:hypothetical protein [Cupriavidus sp. BIS7]
MPPLEPNRLIRTETRPLEGLSMLRHEVAAFIKDLRREASSLSSQQNGTPVTALEELLWQYLLNVHPRTRLLAFAAAVDICPRLAVQRLDDAHTIASDCPLLRALFWSATRRLRLFGWLSPRCTEQ